MKFHPLHYRVLVHRLATEDTAKEQPLEESATPVGEGTGESSPPPVKPGAEVHDRSPIATAVVTSAMLRTWAVRFDAIRFTLSLMARHVPLTTLTFA
jgi:hypothetical protein